MKSVVGTFAVAFVILLAVVTSYLVPGAGYAADPVATAGATLGVVIPPSGSATATASPSPSSTGGGGDDDGGGDVGGGGDDDGDLPTLADGTPIPPDNPTDGADALDLDRETVSANGWVVATGTGFRPGEKVQFVLYPGAIVIGSFVADAGGTVIARFKITDEARPGTYVVEATGWQSFRVLNAEFRVVAESDAGVFPFLWWVLVVIGVILAALLAAAIYFRRTIRSWFGRTPATGAVS